MPQIIYGTTSSTLTRPRGSAHAALTKPSGDVGKSGLPLRTLTLIMG